MRTKESFFAETSIGAEPKYKDTFGIDRQQLSKTMISLNEIYDLHQQVNQPLHTEPEFRCYSILLKVQLLLMFPRVFLLPLLLRLVFLQAPTCS